MKIISVFKDYYDYLSGVYGTDPLTVYVRQPKHALTDLHLASYKAIDGSCISDVTNSLVITGENLSPLLLDACWLTFYICDKRYRIFVFRKRYYATKVEMNLLYNSLAPGEAKTELSHWIEQQPKAYGRRKTRAARKYREHLWKEEERPVTINTDTGFPALLQYQRDIYINPNLGSFGISRLIAPRDIYLQITQFLSKKDPAMPSDPKDMFRYEAKGFDKKTSFRPNMKTP